MAKQDQQDAEKQKEKIVTKKVESNRKEEFLSSGWISIVVAWCKSWGWRIAAVVCIFLIADDVPHRVHDAATLFITLAAVSGYGAGRLLRRESQALDIGLLSGAAAAGIVLVILLAQGAYFLPLRMNPV